MVQPMQMTLTDAGGRIIYLPRELALDDDRQTAVVPGVALPGKPGRWEYPHLIRRDDKVLRASGTIDGVTREQADHMAMELRSQLFSGGLMQLRRDAGDDRYVPVRCIDMTHHYHRGRFRGRLASFAIQFEAADPFWYSSQLTHVTEDIDGFGAPAHIIDVDNVGGESVSPLIRITGRPGGTTSPRLTNMTTGRVLEYDGTLADEQILTLETSRSSARTLGSSVLHSGTAQGGSRDTVILAGGASGADGEYVRLPIELTGGTGSGQSRTIIGYNGTTKTAIVDTDWNTNPASGTAYEIKSLADTEHFWLYEGQVMALDAATNAVSRMNDDYILYGFPLAPGVNRIEVFGETDRMQIEIIFRARWG